MGTYYAKLVCGVKCKEYLYDELCDCKVPVTVGSFGNRKEQLVYDKEGHQVFDNVKKRVFRFSDKTNLVGTKDMFHIREVEKVLSKFRLSVITSQCENWVQPYDFIGIHLNDEYLKEGYPESLDLSPLCFYCEDELLYHITQDVIKNGVNMHNIGTIMSLTSIRLGTIGIKEKPQINTILHVSY